MISQYSFLNDEGSEDTYVTFDLIEAEKRAIKYGLKVICNDYEWVDSEEIFDYTTEGRR